MIILTSLYFTTNLRWFCKDLQLFRTLGLYMTKQPLVRRPYSAWQSSPADVESEGWQGSALQSTLALSFTNAISSMLAMFALLFSAWKIFYACHRRKGNNVWEKKWLALENTLDQEFGKLSYFSSFIFLLLSPSLLVFLPLFCFCLLSLSFLPSFVPTFCSSKIELIYPKCLITWSIFYMHKGVVHCIIFKCIIINTGSI